MNKFCARRLLSLLIVLMLVFPVMVFASPNDDVKIKSVYFQDEDGNMVFVDYEGAVSSSMDQDYILYSAIKRYVGNAEVKGRELYLETNGGSLIDYGLAMRDNKFMLQDIINIDKYYISGEIEFTHELKVVDGVAKIVKIESGGTDPDPDPATVYIKKIFPVAGITVELGTDESEAIGLLNPTTTIADSNEKIHIVDLNWTIENYDGDYEGEYNAIGRFQLPDGIKNTGNMNLQVEAIVEVLGDQVEDWPKEVEDVFVGESQITNQTYGNIKIKNEYVSVVKAVYLDNDLGNQMEDQLSQWRIVLVEGTNVEDLRGRIIVELEEEDEDEELHIEFKEDILLGEGFGLGSLLTDPDFAKDYPNATQYAVVYCVGNSKTTLVLSDMVILGEFTEDLVQYIEDVNVISIALYDADDNLIAFIEDVMKK